MLIEDLAQKVIQEEMDLEECLEDILDKLGSDAAVYFLRLLFQDLLQEQLDVSEQVSKKISKAVVYDEESAEAVVSALGGDKEALARLMDGIPKHLAHEFGTQSLGVLQTDFQDYLQSHFGLDKRTATTISQQVVTEKAGVAVKRALEGDSASMEALLNNLSADLTVQLVRPQFKRFLQTDAGLDRATAEDLSVTFITKANVVDVKKALAGDEKATQRVIQAVLVASAARGLASLFR